MWLWIHNVAKLYRIACRQLVMLYHTSVSNCYYYVVTIALSITDRLICSEYSSAFLT